MKKILILQTLFLLLITVLVGAIISADKVDITGKAVSFKTNISKTIGPFTKADSDKILQYYVGNITLTNDELEKYDVNEDGKVDVFDSQQVLKAAENGGYLTYSGTFEINPYSSSRTIVLHDDQSDKDEIIFSLMQKRISNLSVGHLSVDNMNIQEMPETLYFNYSGTTGTVYLSDDVANYSYIEIFYNKSECGEHSVKVSDPSYKTVNLILTQLTADQTVLQTLAKKVTISSSSIRVDTYSSGYSNALSSGRVEVSSENNIYITNVIGYK